MSNQVLAGAIGTDRTPDEGVRGRSAWWLVFARLRRHHLAMLAVLVLSAITILVVLGPMLSPYDPDQAQLRDRLQPPSRSHWMGTDDLGRDVFVRTLYGGRVSLTVGVLVALLSSLLGILIGAIAGYFGGAGNLGRSVETLLMRFTDIMMSIPNLPLLLILSRFVGGGSMWGITLVLAAFSWMSLARIVRASTLSLREAEFVNGARVAGASHDRIIFVHILPNALAPIIVYTTLNIGYAILAESTLSYLGLGIQPPTPSWGNMLMNAQQHLQTLPFLAVLPGFYIFVTLLSFNFLGDGLRDALDPRLDRGGRAG